MLQTAKKFWLNADLEKLAKYWKYDKKLPYDIQILIPFLHEAKVIWDGACGDKRITKALSHIFLNTNFICTDLKEWDLTDGLSPDARNADIVLLLGVIQYLDDLELRSLLHELKNKKVIIKANCGNNEYINKYSEDMGGNYESLYRSVESIENILLTTHTVNFLEMNYPENLNSKFGKQYLFIGDPCK